MNNKITPLYIFSIPRSGSTLLQRILSSHAQISTKPETWFLLPLLYMTKDEGVLAEYGYSKFRNGFEDFRKDLKYYNDHLKDFILKNYKDSSDNQAVYFIDKTPRYSLISDKIIDLFNDEAKYIFLWRNPLSVASSMIESWGGGKWNLYKYEI
ncbi:MAG: sulfotransferase, partial [Bacteroidetes bacterium]|nr:sulfotransferase [Bacteroidota bacterium]